MKEPDWAKDPDGVLERRRQDNQGYAATIAGGVSEFFGCLVFLVFIGGVVGGCAYLIGWAGNAGAQHSNTIMNGAK